MVATARPPALATCTRRLTPRRPRIGIRMPWHLLRASRRVESAGLNMGPFQVGKLGAPADLIKVKLNRTTLTDSLNP